MQKNTTKFVYLQYRNISIMVIVHVLSRNEDFLDTDTYSGAYVRIQIIGSTDNSYRSLEETRVFVGYAVGSGYNVILVKNTAPAYISTRNLDRYLIGVFANTSFFAAYDSLGLQSWYCKQI